MKNTLKHYGFVWLLFYPSISVLMLPCGIASIIVDSWEDTKDLFRYVYIEMPRLLDTKYNETKQ